MFNVLEHYEVDNFTLVVHGKNTTLYNFLSQKLFVDDEKIIMALLSKLGLSSYTHQE